MTELSGTDLALTFPVTAVNLVMKPEADQHNAWDVLVSAYGAHARYMVLAREGGDAVLDMLGVSTQRR